VVGIAEAKDNPATYQLFGVENNWVAGKHQVFRIRSKKGTHALRGRRKVAGSQSLLPKKKGGGNSPLGEKSLETFPRKSGKKNLTTQ